MTCWSHMYLSVPKDFPTPASKLAPVLQNSSKWQIRAHIQLSSARSSKAHLKG